PSAVIIVDFKSGPEYPKHIEELRHYALLETIRTGVPPRKIAAHYLDASRFRDEDVTEDVLDSARQRATDGIRRLSALWAGSRDPELTAGPMCPHCPAFSTCSTGQEWTRSHSS